MIDLHSKTTNLSLKIQKRIKKVNIMAYYYIIIIIIIIIITIIIILADIKSPQTPLSRILTYWQYP